MSTMQELFDAAFLGVWNQGCGSHDVYGSCKYRGPNDTKCAAGHIIPDHLYRGCMEGNGFCEAAPFKEVIKNLQLGSEEIYLILQLQNAHDSRPRHGVEAYRLDWEHECGLIATKFGLKMPDLPGHEPCDTQASS